MKGIIGISIRDYIWKATLTLNSKVKELTEQMVDENSAKWLKEACNKGIEDLVKDHMAKKGK